MSVAARQRSKLSTLQRINVSIANRQQTRAIDLRMLRRIVHTLLSELLQTGHRELGISFVASPEMTRLNETFLRHAGSTDVITFDYSSYESRITNHESRLHGEIFICVDEAVIQARRFRTSWQSELVRYIVHGVLHLLGFDDARPVRQGMKSEENRLLLD
jgi:probable rRNA maturation factor